MKKHKLVVLPSGQQWSFSNLPCFLPIVSQYFDFEPYQADKYYDPSTVFLIMGSVYDAEMAHRFADCRVIVDLCIEGFFGKWGELYKFKFPNHCFLYGSYIENPPDDLVSIPNFIRYTKTLIDTDTGYNNYVPNRNYAKKFLMPIGAKRKWRDRVVERLDPYLHDAYWSYVRRGTVLPGDPLAQKLYDKWNFNPMWYNDTCFSVVIESFNGQRLNAETPVFLTEKVFKPIAGYQPFVVVGGAGILAYLKSQGFETYDNLFDESYDTEIDLDKKLDIIARNIENYVKQPYDALTLEKTKHNFELFYNVDVAHRGIVTDIVEPIVKFIEK
jgi:hypothetical protein